jgi:hypothetical protein
MPESGDDKKTAFDPRPPGQRRRASDDSDGASSSSRRGRRSRDGGDKPVKREGIVRRLTGRAELDRAKRKRFDPYSFESNNTQVKWVVIALVAWSVVALLLAWQDSSTASYLTDLRDQGMMSAPPTRQSTLRDVQQIIDFGAREGVRCETEQQIIELTPECSRLLDVQDKFTSLKDTGAMLFVLLMFILLANMFAFGSFGHRASRNILALNNRSQRFVPEKAVMWFFIPGLNLFRPWQVFKEIFRGSDPDVSTTDELAWKSKGRVPAVVHVWALIFVGVFFFNPRTIGWFWYPIRETLDDVLVAHSRLIIADILLAVLGVAAIFVVLELHKRQEARHAKVGAITVTPPPPSNPLEEALKEGIRRKDLENLRARNQEK